MQIMTEPELRALEATAIGPTVVRLIETVRATRRALEMSVHDQRNIWSVEDAPFFVEDADETTVPRYMETAQQEREAACRSPKTN